MYKNIFIIILLIGSLVAVYIWFNRESDYKKKIEVIEKRRDSLVQQIAVHEFKFDSLQKIKQIILYKYKETEAKLKKQENETDAIPGIVATYSNSKLDSILTNYRFEPRAKSRNSNRP